jgi:hypothetical protein
MTSPRSCSGGYETQFASTGLFALIMPRKPIQNSIFTQRSPYSKNKRGLVKRTHVLSNLLDTLIDRRNLLLE